MSILGGQGTYHSNFNCELTQPQKINIILLLIPEKVNTLQTQEHCMTLNINLTRALNPTQTAIDVYNHLAQLWQYQFESF